MKCDSLGPVYLAGIAKHYVPFSDSLHLSFSKPPLLPLITKQQRMWRTAVHSKSRDVQSTGSLSGPAIYVFYKGMLEMINCCCP